MDKMPRLSSLTLITNGLAVERILAGSRNLLEMCTERGIHFNVSVSLDGVGPVHDEMRNVPGAFGRVEKCLAGLKKLQAEQPFWLGAACVITRKNLYQLHELQAWCAERDIELGFQLVGFHDTYVANLERRGDLDFSEAEREYLLELLQELALIRSPFDFTTYYWDDMLRMYREGRPRHTPCPFAVDSFVLDAYGDMYYCLSERKIGNCLGRGGDKDSHASPGGEVSTAESPAPGPCSAVYYDPQNLAFRRELTRSACLRCNSGCFVNVGIKKDVKGYLWFLLRRSLGVYPG
jgi:MoaA/NifB/PqqE/SkfB family radical SAM enzyme